MCTPLIPKNNPSFNQKNPYYGYIQVNDRKGNRFYHQNINDPSEAEAFIKANGISTKSHNWLKAIIIPTRTDNLKDFLKDIFLPTFVNQALNINNIALRLFASFFALALDVITLLPRLCVAPFKVKYDRSHPQPIHPLNEELGKKWLSQLEIEIYQEKNSVIDTNAEGMSQAKAEFQKIHFWVQTKVNPGDKKLHAHYSENYEEIYSKVDKDWALVNQAGVRSSSFQSMEELKVKLSMA